MAKYFELPVASWAYRKIDRWIRDSRANPLRKVIITVHLVFFASSSLTYVLLYFVAQLHIPLWIMLLCMGFAYVLVLMIIVLTWLVMKVFP